MTTIDFRRLLRFARDLQQANDLDTLLRTSQREVREVTGYQHAWLSVFEPDMANARNLSIASDRQPVLWEHAAAIPVEGDEMMAEIVRGDAPVVVVDAQTDPRTNKEIVGKIGCWTIINIPMRLLDSPLGTLGTGTFGDEGPRPPTPEQLDYLMGMASQIAVAFTRIRWHEERERLERERAAVQRRVLVAQKMESIGVLAGGVAHDLNNVLLLVLLNAKLVERDPLTARQSEALKTVIGAVERGASLTQQLLGMARPQPQHLAPVDLNQRLEALLGLLRSSMPPSVSVELSLQSARPICVGDAAQLDQVFMNLCVNARDAMPSGGRLRLETSDIALSEAFVEHHPWARPGRYVLVSVSDTGTGMQPELLERIFEPFFTTKEVGKGTGLGLTVAYGIVRQHGGLLHVYSEPLVGTTMRVYLPAHEQGQTPSPRAGLAGPEPLGDERILVADDDPDIRASVVRILEEAGYRVTTASDGAEAIAAAAREPFELVLLDVVMPKVSGRHAYDHIRDLRPGLPCLFSTGYAPELLPMTEGESPAVEVLRKPYDPDTLLRAVRRTLDLHRR